MVTTLTVSNHRLRKGDPSTHFSGSSGAFAELPAAAVHTGRQPALPRRSCTPYSVLNSAWCSAGWDSAFSNTPSTVRWARFMMRTWFMMPTRVVDMSPVTFPNVLSTVSNAVTVVLATADRASRLAFDANIK